MSHDIAQLLPLIRSLQNDIRDAVVDACETQSIERLSTPVAEDECDTIYHIDRISEQVLVERVESEIASIAPVILIAEGITDGKLVLPRGTDENDAIWRIIVDPIDGTRCIMHQKRPAWVLTGVAPNRGEETNLSHIELAVQTEIPLIKQHLSDQTWAIRGQGVHAIRHNRVTGEDIEIPLRPSQADSILHGYAMLVRLFPGVRDEIAAIEEEMLTSVIGPPVANKALCFEDQYASSGAQVYSLATGEDRFVGDIRPIMEPIHRQRGLPSGLYCHPYDICTALIAIESGVPVVAVNGEPLSNKLDVTSPVAWAGYANERIRKQLEPALHEMLRKRGLNFRL